MTSLDVVRQVGIDVSRILYSPYGRYQAIADKSYLLGLNRVTQDSWSGPISSGVTDVP